MILNVRLFGVKYNDSSALFFFLNSVFTTFVNQQSPDILMDFLEVIEKRHSVRRFTDEPVDRELLDAIIGIAQTAPSSKNCHSSAFMVIEDKDTLLAVSEMRDRGSAFLKGAPAAIVVMGDRSRSDIWVENASISATFIQLAATALDLGSCWVHVRDRQRSSADPSKGTAEDYLRGLLGIREEYGVLCVIALGHEDAAPL